MSGSVLTWSCKQGGSRSQPICLRERWQIKGYSCSLAVKTRNPCSPLTPLCNTHNTHPTGSFLAFRKCRGNALSGSSVLENRHPMCRWGCASGRPAVPQPPSSLSSGPAAPRWCCWGPGRPSPASPWASCCSGGRTPTPLVTPRTAGRAPPGTRMSPCRSDWAGHGKRPSYTWTSPFPLSPAWSASHRCLKGSIGGEKWDIAIKWSDMCTTAGGTECLLIIALNTKNAIIASLLKLLAAGGFFLNCGTLWKLQMKSH